MLDFVELGLDIKHKIKYAPVAHIRNKQLFTVKNKPNNFYCSVNLITNVVLRF